MPYLFRFPSADLTCYMFFVQSPMKIYFSVFVRPKYSTFYSEAFVNKTLEFLAYIFIHKSYFTAIQERELYVCIEYSKLGVLLYLRCPSGFIQATESYSIFVQLVVNVVIHTVVSRHYASQISKFFSQMERSDFRL